MREEVETLLNSDLSPYQISKLSNYKIPTNTIYKLRKGEYNVDNLTLKVIEEMIRINNEYVK